MMNIAILGGGVAGLSSAIALKQKGFDVSVYERHPAETDIGAGMVLWPNAAYVLDRLGLLTAVEAVSGRPCRMRRLSDRNEDLGCIDIGAINQRMGYASLSVIRSDFQRILRSSLEALGVSIRYSHAAVHIESSAPDHAKVRFQDGSEIGADVLIGADGRMASCARRHVHGGNAPVYQGFINWIGVYESAEELFDDIEVSDYWGLGERFGIVAVTKHLAYWAGAAACADIGPRIQSAYPAELAAIFSGWPQPIQRIIEGTPAERINKVYVHDHDPIRTWHKGRLLVIGDAAHASLPTSGQGACQALEDAWHLANVLGDSPHDVQSAFARFTALRLEKTSGITVAARGFASSLFSLDKHVARARNENSRNTDFSKVAAAMARGWSQHLPLARSD